MATLYPVIRQALAGRDRSGTLFECRHCGERVDRGTTECPSCGRAEIAEYDLE